MYEAEEVKPTNRKIEVFIEGERARQGPDELFLDERGMMIFGDMKDETGGPASI